ncbi:hypothetical protein CDEST_11438 [Colletotrichum destructivum]|uniref:Uncharacterized protein n=1 Tax=Colletotrichum destructivum TaxID=34406 RepID=A0AAX4IT20_9PEZI|nr:hypothetical protein CDEST_11438 [Colletotrichum destructivum]
MQISKLFLATLLPFMASANEHTSCWCQIKTSDECQKSACTAYGLTRAFFNLPREYNIYNAATRWQGTSCQVVTQDGVVSGGLGGNEYEKVCQDNCHVGSSCDG